MALREHTHRARVIAGPRSPQTTCTGVRMNTEGIKHMSLYSRNSISKGNLRSALPGAQTPNEYKTINLSLGISEGNQLNDAASVNIVQLGVD